MLSWLFKKPGELVAPKAHATPAPASKSAQPAPAVTSPKPKPKLSEVDVAEWAARLLDAQGDEAALLRVAQTAPAIDIKLAAVNALFTEAMLRQAEREFRSHDRKVHRVAKQRLEAAVAQREARAAAQGLLERTRALLGEPEVPVNHVVEVDREWAALPAHVLEPAQCAAFAELRELLDAALREQIEAQQQLQRWLANAKTLLPEWRRSIPALAEQGGTSDLAALAQAIGQCRQTRPEVAATAEVDAALAQLLDVCALVEPRLAWFEKLPADVAAATPLEPAEPAEPTLQIEQAADAAEASEPTATPLQRWQALPPLPAGALGLALESRHERWLQSTRPAAVFAQPPTVKPARPPKVEALTAEQRVQLESFVRAAESALAEGLLGEMQNQLQAIDAIMAKARAPALPEHLQARHQILWAERARLKDWQQWGGGRARDDLTAEAEALARSTLPVAIVADAPEGAAAATPQRPKLNLKTLGDSIQALRKRWRELDQLGAAASGELWHRFDAALHTAHQPIAAQHAVLKAARQENLAEREALLTALEAVPLPGGQASIDWREPLRELDRFQLAWRKLGPLEHTVPADARTPLQQRLGAAVDRIEGPLAEARRQAAGVREDIIARAEALVPEPGRALAATEITRNLRELQAEWQDHARQLPLPRALEKALWTRFRSATEAVFAQREAAFAARDVELAAHLAAAEALIDRLAALSVESTEVEIRRTLAEVDRAWRQGGEVPRAAIEGLEARYHAVRAAASDLVAAGARHRWQTRCETLALQLTLCATREGQSADGADAAEAAELEQRWAARGALPAPWEQALAQRWSQPLEPGPLPQAAVDDGLLQLEAALNMPATPEQQDARRQLKLRALKDAMDSRAAPRRGPTAPADWLLALLRQGRPTPLQSQRLLACVAALRQAAPGALGLPTDAA